MVIGMQKKEEMQEQESEVQAKQSDLDSEITSVIQEKIKERPVNGRKLVRRTAITVLMAMVFGLVACVTFLLLEPVINKMIYPEEKAQPVRFPEEEQEVKPEDMAADEAELQIIREEEAAESGRENSAEGIGANDGESVETVEEISPEEAAKIAAFDGYKVLYDALAGLRKEAEKSIVSVMAVTSDVNWINDTLENTGVTSGLVVADNGKELLILADYGALREADSISILFGEEEKEASLKEVDRTTGFAVLAVPLTAFDETEREAIVYAPLGSSAGRALVGQPVMAVGSPMGIGGSACYGMVTSQGAAMGLVDSNYKLLTTDMYGSRTASGVLVNMQGEIVGVLCNSHDGDMENRICGIGISELKRTIEKLSNGEKMAYLGTRGADINTATYQKYGLPKGAYVTTVEMDSPAMKAGLQNGDIITKVDNESIFSYTELINKLMRSQIGQSMRFAVARQRKGEYQEMNVTVTLQEQPGK